MTDRARIIQPAFLFSVPKWDPKKVGDLPQVCVCGRSNVGKSSLINALVGQTSLAKTSSTPGRTQHIVVFDVKIRREGETLPFLLVDLPGYGFANVPLEVKKTWRPMMESYFLSNPKIALLLFLLDIRRTPSEDDLELLEMAGDNELPVLPVVTKIDKVPKTQRARELKKIAQKLEVEADDLRPTSASERHGTQDLVDEVFDVLRGGDEEAPHVDGAP